MPRRPRIDFAGYHHVLNRGVAKTDVFLQKEDYDLFLKIVCKACKAYRAVVHGYCLMTNHYHLLVETELDNLSLLMKQINSNYAMYFNRRYDRSGHLWQGRYTSRYVTIEAYLYVLIRYIEYNPVKAKLVDHPGEHSYTLCAVLLNKKAPISCSLHSIVLQQLDYDGIRELLAIEPGEKDMEIIEALANQKVISKADTKRQAYEKELQEHFNSRMTKFHRNQAIVEAMEDGYTQAEIAKHLDLSRSAISRIVKSAFSTPDPEE